MRGKDRSNSLRDNSMKMVVNIVKQSSFSIANMSLGVAKPSTTAKDLGLRKGSIAGDNEPLLPQFPGSQKSEKPWNSPKPIFLMEPSGEDKSSYANKLHEEKFANYIMKVHQKNQSFSEASNLSQDILPPPPRAVM
ncbi:hypothetical protein Patl1_17942 [Pistacia atlantica]|uniref:Uncharacterized protein n=1 Tax=Pistacia atlantica TaxID=434234 RepID=A0ACC1C010_9ROSI|nr:hypothetical protein Patl1_17942 [Pistacia atlantica]